MNILLVAEKHNVYTSFVRFPGRENGGGVLSLAWSLVAGGCFSVGGGVSFVDLALCLAWSRSSCTIAAERGGGVFC